FGYGYPTRFFVPLAGGSFVTNRCFAWRFLDRPTAPRPHPSVLPAAKAPGTVRIFLLGEDAAFGTPDPSYSFGRILEVMLGQRRPDTRCETITAAAPALDSHAIRAIAADCARHRPDLFLVYMGNNEVVGPHGPRAAPRRPGLIRAGAWVQESRL